MSLVFHDSQEIIDLAVNLLKPYRSTKAGQRRIEIHAESGRVKYSEDTLFIPNPTSLSQAVYDILLASVLSDNGYRVDNIPLVLTELVQNLSDLVVAHFEAQQVETTEFHVDEKGYLYVPYKYLGTDDTEIRFVFLPNFVEIHTSIATFAKPRLEQESTELKKPFIDSINISYDPATGSYRAKMKKKLLELAPLIDGEYVVYRHRIEEVEETQVV